MSTRETLRLYGTGEAGVLIGQITLEEVGRRPSAEPKRRTR
jgi:hypothetical protein